MKTFDECSSEGKIKLDASAKKWVAKEIKSAEYALGSAEKIKKIKENEGVMIFAYNSIMHLNRALVFSKGFSVKGHLCLIKAVQKLFSENKELLEFSSSFERALESRNLIQYEGYVASQEQAEFMLSLAQDYLISVKKLLKF
jgi:uncharacterized protein (UPF0332 family)